MQTQKKAVMMYIFISAVTICCILLPLGFISVSLKTVVLLYALLSSSTYLQGVIKDKCY